VKFKRRKLFLQEIKSLSKRKKVDRGFVSNSVRGENNYEICDYIQRRSEIEYLNA
jgi:hypothetical protein